MAIRFASLPIAGYFSGSNKRALGMWQLGGGCQREFGDTQTWSTPPAVRWAFRHINQRWRINPDPTSFQRFYLCLATLWERSIQKLSAKHRNDISLRALSLQKYLMKYDWWISWTSVSFMFYASMPVFPDTVGSNQGFYLEFDATRPVQAVCMVFATVLR